jgi:hypothetical protein
MTDSKDAFDLWRAWGVDSWLCSWSQAALRQPLFVAQYNPAICSLVHRHLSPGIL